MYNATIRMQIATGARAQGVELTSADVHTEIDSEAFGKVQEIDVGRRVWLRAYGIVMEHCDARDYRKSEVF